MAPPMTALTTIKATTLLSESVARASKAFMVLSLAMGLVSEAEVSGLKLIPADRQIYPRG
jgi:hypothetical protein